jgi:uncharacterized protein (UPF0332 family)
MTAEQTALLRKAETSLQAAKLLATEGYYDIAVSRAYYTMFYVAQALLLQDGLAFSKHSAVIAAFGQHFARTGRVPVEFHRYLIEAGEQRNTGDYDLEPNLTLADAERQLTRATQFIELGYNLSGNMLSPSAPPNNSPNAEE